MDKRRKRITCATIASSTILICFGIYKYLEFQISKEGSDLWFKFANLEELKKYRETIGEKFKNSGLNNMNEKEYIGVERMKFKLDKYIGIIENIKYDIEHQSLKIVCREHGRYLPNND